MTTDEKNDRRWVVAAQAADVHLHLIVRAADSEAAAASAMGWVYATDEPPVDRVVSVRPMKDAPIATVSVLYDGVWLNPE